MRKLLVLLLVVALHLSATVNAGMQWDVRSTGSDTNGGGYDATVAAPGTDFSQQDAAQVSYTDLVIGATTTQATSAAFPFGSTHPGNVVNVISGTGCTVGRHEVVSVSGTTATFSESLGTAASTCTAKLGGALLTLPPAVQYAANLNTVWIKSSTYTYTAQQVLSPAAAGTTITLSGYTATHGDGYPTRPTITTATNSVDLVGFSNTRNSWTLIWKGINISSTAGTPGVCLADVNGINPGAYISDTIISGCSVGVNFGGVNRGTYWDVNNQSFQNVEVRNCTSHGLAVYGNGSTAVQTFISASYFHNNGGSGVLGNSGANGVGVSMTRSISASNTGSGLSLTGTNWVAILSQNDLANNTADGLTLSSSGTGYLGLDNNVFSGNGGWGANDPNTLTFVRWNTANAYGTNTSGNRNGVSASALDVSLTTSPFASSTNFAPNTTAGGGAALKGAGFPGTFSGGTTVGAPDIGAVQSACVASASAFACGFSQLIAPDLPR